MCASLNDKNRAVNLRALKIFSGFEYQSRLLLIKDLITTLNFCCDHFLVWIPFPFCKLADTTNKALSCSFLD